MDITLREAIFLAVETERRLFDLKHEISKWIVARHSYHMTRYISIQNVIYDRLPYDVYRTGIFGE